MREVRQPTSRQLHAARMLLGWTQRHLAERAGVSVATVQRIERRKALPQPSTMSAVQRALVKGGIAFVSGEGVRFAEPNEGR